MFGIFESLAKAAIGVVTLPVSAVADVVTMGGALNDKNQPYLAKNAAEILKNLENAASSK